MPTPRDEEFLRFAVASGHLSDEQAKESLAALADIERLGGSASAPEVALKRGLLNERQVALVQQAIAASRTGARVPRELSGFELLEKIGQGGMGSVFKARQKELNRVIALKILSPRLARSPEFVEQFLREARSAGRLNHPNIVAAIDVGESQGFYYFAMEYVDGETVAKLLARGGPLPEDRALAIAADVARALDHANQKGLIHRDIKPDNIMVTADGRVRVTDFGLAKAIGKGAPGGTDTERFLGTPAYVAPEQIRSEPDIDCRADIFSLGVTLFQMLTGQLPFKGANPMAVAAAVVAEPLPSLRKLRPDLALAAVRVVERMTAKDPAQRYTTPAEAVQALESAAAAPRLPTPRAATPRLVAARRRSSNSLAYLGAALALIAVAVLAGWLWARAQRRRAAPPDTTPGTVTFEPQAPPKTPPPKTPEPVVTDTALEALIRAVEAANRFEEQNPRDYPALIAKLRHILEGYPPHRRERLAREGVDLLVETEAKLKRLEERLDGAADAELKARVTRAEALLAEGKINEALALLDTFPTTLRAKTATASIESLRSQWSQKAVALFNARDAEAKKLIEQAKLDEAKALYEPFTQCAVAEIASRAKEAIATIEHEHTTKLAEARRLARAAYVKEAIAIFDHLEGRRLREARNLADAAAVSPALAPLRDDVKLLQHLVRTVGEVWTAAGLGLKKLRPGDRFRINGMGCDVVQASEDRLTVRFGAKVVTAYPLTGLKADDVTALAVSGYGAASPQNEAKLGLFLLAERDHDGARKRIEGARADGADVTRELELLGRFSPRTCPTCKGEKTVPCPDCDGKGALRVERQECPVCKGKGGGPCGWCNARGRMRCTNCGGTGRVLGGTLLCNECGGRGWVRCSHCGGSGYLKCSRCEGKGQLTIVTPCARCKGSKVVPCPKCDGKGVLPPPDLTPPAEAPAPAGPTPAPAPGPAPPAPP